MSMFKHLATIWSLVGAHPATRNKRFAAMYRYAYWQLRRRFTGKPMRIRTVNGGRLLVFPSRTSTTAAYYLGLPDFEDMLFMLHLLRPGDRFLDGGANLGVWSVLAATAGANVVAVEPAPDTFSLLNRQISENGYGDRIHPVQCALADKKGVLWLSTGRDAGNSIQEQGQGTEITAETLDDITAGKEPTMIKLDLEGYELEALRGASKLLESQSLMALVIETFRPQNWSQENLREIERLLGERGFLPYEYHPAERRLSPLVPLDPGPGNGGQNTIYIRGLPGVMARIQSASAIEVGGKPC
jgi:FkbM family methyltransferase